MPKKPKPLTTDEWVRRLNRIAEKMYKVESSQHHSVWSEQNKELMEEYRRVAKTETTD